MQPIYLTGHSRPVLKVQFNYDGDLLFTCSDDKTVCMYNTYLLERVGLFQIGDSCKSIDVTKDSKLLLATATTKGIKCFDTTNGDMLAELTIPGLRQTKQVELSYSDKYFAVVYEDMKGSQIRIFETATVLAFGKKDSGCPDHIMSIEPPKDHTVTCVKWGPLDETIFYCTDRGRLIQYDVEKHKVVNVAEPHRQEVFSMEITPDFTMMYTCSRDGTCKLLHPETFDEIRCIKFDFPCRSSSMSPLYAAEENQKFHLLVCGGQDAKDVTTTGAGSGGFEIKLYNVIYNESLANIKGHFGTVHSVAFHPDGMSFATGSEDGYVHYHRMLPEYFTKRFE